MTACDNVFPMSSQEDEIFCHAEQCFNIHSTITVFFSDFLFLFLFKYMFHFNNSRYHPYAFFERVFHIKLNGNFEGRSSNCIFVCQCHLCSKSNIFCTGFVGCFFSFFAFLFFIRFGYIASGPAFGLMENTFLHAEVDRQNTTHYVSDRALCIIPMCNFNLV